MDYNFHTHTARCGHATGLEEDYVRCAIAGGIRHMGFSEHIPYLYPDGFEFTGVRVPMAQVDEHRQTVLELKRKYAGQIDLHLGFEMEYYPEHFSRMLANARSWGAEYLILGQHYVGSDHPKYIYAPVGTDDPEKLRAYTDSVIAAMGTGVYTYVAHPDVFRFSGDAEVYREQAWRICAASRKLDLPLEINFLGIRDHRQYPNELFWEVAGQEYCPVTFGFDAHTPESAADLATESAAMALVEKYDLKYIGMPKLVAL